MLSPDMPPRLTRRQTIGAAAGLALGSSAGLGPLLASAQAAQLSLTPELTEGPYYVALERIRRDITGGQLGVPLHLLVHVRNASTGVVVTGAAVDVWHCSARGAYSDESVDGTAGQTFLRGVQLTDESGRAQFVTVYPGHYQGRAVHIHVKVHVAGSHSASRYSGGHVCHTGQLFFNDSISTEVFAHAPYTSNRVARVLNSADRIYREGGSQSVARLTRLGTRLTRDGLRGAVTLAVDPRSTPAAV